MLHSSFSVSVYLLTCQDQFTIFYFRKCWICNQRYVALMCKFPGNPISPFGDKRLKNTIVKRKYIKEIPKKKKKEEEEEEER